MHHDVHEMICPNCGYPAVENYCAQCGQETHLHKETFWGLVVHFLGHYFHYDSKFWQTMKALLFSPGKLTIAYWNKQRMRYIAPISLYIFISFVYFLVSVSMPGDDMVLNQDPKQKGLNFTTTRDAVGSMTFSTDSATTATNKKGSGNKSVDSWIDNKFKSIKDKHEDPGAFLNESIKHDIPRLFFFLIPMMAGLLKALYVRRKDVFFVDHAIFALHFHSFWFSIFMLRFPLAFLMLRFPGNSIVGNAYGLMMVALIITAVLYMIKAIKNVYGAGIGKALLYTFIIGLVYTISLVILFILNLLLIFSFA